MGDVSRSIPWIYATFDNHQEDHQSSMIEIEGKINDLSISILIDFGASYSYASTNLVERCKLVSSK